MLVNFLIDWLRSALLCASRALLSGKRNKLCTCECEDCMQSRFDSSPYAETVKLQSIQDVDKNIIFRDYEKKGSPFTYVVKILEINKERLRTMVCLHV